MVDVVAQEVADYTVKVMEDEGTCEYVLELVLRLWKTALTTAEPP